MLPETILTYTKVYGGLELERAKSSVRVFCTVPFDGQPEPFEDEFIVQLTSICFLPQIEKTF